MKKYLLVISSMIFIACTPSKPMEKTYVVTCSFPRETTVDTIVTTDNLWHYKQTYRIDQSHYSTAFCNVRTTINETR